VYGDWVHEVDWSVGQVLDALRKNNLDENTLVIFTSDNGPWLRLTNRTGVAGPLRGGKGGTLEGGVREPTIAWWPGKIKAGSKSDAIAVTTDLLPTFAKLAGAKLDPSIKIDGYDISPVLLGQARKSERQAWYYYLQTELQAVRSGPWKLAIKPQRFSMGFKEIPKDLNNDGPRLYNLNDDIGETTNVAAQHPEVVARLQKLADKMIADIGSGKDMGPGVRPAGQVDNPMTLYPTEPKKKR
ncbi:MAG: sulfatase-like hydrolase/transferase, partial [Planctomycetota bacterium]